MATPRWLATVSQEPLVRTPIAIGLGAIAGALSRYYLGLWIGGRLGPAFPYGTFIINLTGCLGMGFFTTLTEQTIISPDVKSLIAVGFLGSYTTFSTYELDSRNLVREGEFGAATFYWAASAILGFVGLQIGVVLARLLTR
ncbi:MAG: fluoride efflux transporter CrcB [Microcoleaceae cyanobacterium]